MRMMCSRGGGKSGFTLIELMAVLVIIALLSAMIIPELRGTYESALLRSSGRELVDVFNTAYSRAITVNQLHRVRLDKTTGKYVIERRARKGEGESGYVTVKDLPGGEGKIDGRISIEMGKPEPADNAEP